MKETRIPSTSPTPAQPGDPSAEEPGRRFTGRLAAAVVPYRFPIAVWLAVHALLLVVAWWSPHLIGSPNIAGNASWLPRGLLPAPLDAWARPWFRFDARWYVSVVLHGYQYGSPPRANTNFLPLYPALIAVARPLAGGNAWLAAWGVANAAQLGAYIALYAWGTRVLGCGRGTRFLLLFAAVPFGLFLMAPYAEALFVLLACLAFLCLESCRFRWAVGAAALATIARPVGIAVVVGIALQYLQRGERWRAVLSLVAALPIVAFTVYLWVAFGHPEAVVLSHTAGWVPPHGGLAHTLASQFDTQLSPLDRLDAALAVVFILSAIGAWRRLGWGYGGFIAVGVAMPLIHGLAGMERYVAVLFPAMAVWSLWPKRAVQLTLFAVSVFSLLLFTVLFARGFSVF